MNSSFDQDELTLFARKVPDDEASEALLLGGLGSTSPWKKSINFIVHHYNSAFIKSNIL